MREVHSKSSADCNQNWPSEKEGLFEKPLKHQISVTRQNI